jgi:hypothetical protein
MPAGMTAGQEARTLLESLPDNCSIADIPVSLYVLEKMRSRVPGEKCSLEPVPAANSRE